LGTHPPIYFCNQTAYGQYTESQTISNVPAFWTASGDLALAQWMAGTNPIKFEVLYERFCKGTIGNQKLFPGFGPLKSFLLAANYAITNKATTPSTDCMGKIIFEINAGGQKGLSQLGFRCSDTTLTAQSFTFVHDYVSKVIPVNCRNHIYYSVFFVEHMLCKFS
jgi:hypothetical protein